MVGESGQAKMLSLNWGVAVLEVIITVLEKILLGYPVTLFFVDTINKYKYLLTLPSLVKIGQELAQILYLPRELLHPRELLRH